MPARFLLSVALLGLFLSACSGGERSHQSVRLGGEDVEVFTYRPGDCEAAGLLIVFHGMSRNADDYRDHARGIADRHCWVVFAPRFDAERFSIWRYHGGGVVSESGPQPPELWTVHLVAPLVAWARRSAAAPSLPVYLFGHSAGAQFLSRTAAFAALPGVRRIVIANPSTWVMPDLGEPLPFGFAGVPEGLDAEGLLAAYLRQPVTVYLGAEDTGEENLYREPEGLRQGRNRLERGRNVYDAALAAAERYGLACNWQLVEAAGVAHSAQAMLDAPAAARAFAPPPG